MSGRLRTVSWRHYAGQGGPRAQSGRHQVVLDRFAAFLAGPRPEAVRATRCAWISSLDRPGTRPGGVAGASPDKDVQAVRRPVGC